MTAAQARAARAIARWSVADAAAHSGLTGNTVNRFEMGKGARMETAVKLRQAYEQAGIEFLDERTIRYADSYNDKTESVAETTEKG
jgi:transcriptional regulator with XRE-family HTH domain